MKAFVLSQDKLYTTPSTSSIPNSCRSETNTARTSLQPFATGSSQTSPNKALIHTESSQKSIHLNWITAIALVKFDIDQGNITEAIYPSDAFSKSEQKTISLLSFPDSNSFSAEGALKFVFRLKRDNTVATDGFSSVFGYAYFKQERDPSNPRGFSQKSLVILSALPFTGLFKNALDILGAKYFEQGATYDSEQYLKDNYHVIMNEWAKPQPGVQYELSLHGQSLYVSIPKNMYGSKHLSVEESTRIDTSPQDSSREKDDSDDTKESTNASHEERQQSLSTVLCGQSLQEKGCFQDINLYKIFKGSKLPLLWKVWELILTNQPLMIMSDLPSECSEAVLGVLSIICPLEYQTDYKPYFTIFDPEFREVQNLYEKKTAKNAVIGVTNPLFIKTMPNYPNILHLEKEYLKHKPNQSSKPSLLESTQKLYTLPDSSLNNRLIPGENEETDAINNVLLRKSLQNLTESFLSAFKMYFKLQINQIKKFEEKDFMKFLELQKFPFRAQFTSNAHIIKLYAKFLKSPNFLRYIKTFPNVYIVKNV